MDYTHFIAKQFGLLTVLRPIGAIDKVACLCACGAEKIARISHLRSGSVKSCGCLLKSKPKEVHGTHLASRTSEYKAWYGLVKRCNDQNHPAYKHYGGRGIYVCGRWLGDEGFASFLMDMGKKEKGYSIDRIDNNGPYSKENCRWASASIQANNRRTNILFSCLDKTLTLSEWSKVNGISCNTMRERIKSGWSVKEAITTPLRIKKVRNSL